MSNLSSKRLRLLEVLARHQQEGQFPLVRDLAQELGLAGESSLTRMLDALAADGWLQKQGGGRERHRRIFTLTAKAETTLDRETIGLLKLPVVGMVTAGPLRLAVQDAQRYVVPGESLRARRGDFFLEVDGDSMIGDGIFPRDLVLVRPAIRINNGEIAAVQVRRDDGENDSTLKRIICYPNKETVTLRASNQNYEDLIVPLNRIEICGVYRGLERAQH